MNFSFRLLYSSAPHFSLVPFCNFYHFINILYLMPLCHYALFTSIMLFFSFVYIFIRATLKYFFVVVQSDIRSLSQVAFVAYFFFFLVYGSYFPISLHAS